MYQQTFNQNDSKRLEIEAEMSRFEKEVLSATSNVSDDLYKPSSRPVHFIPHQIQRQLPVQRQQSAATFVPAQNNFNNQNNYNNNSGGNGAGAGGNQSAQQNVNYTVTPMQVPSVVHNITSTSGQASTSKTKSKNGHDKGKKQKKLLRMAGGQVWEDPTLTEWDPDDFRIFCGDLGNDVTDEVLTRAFSRFPSFVKAKIVRDKRSSKSRGYGFVSFKNPQDFARAMKEMNGKYVGSRPIKLRKSNWKDRNMDVVKKKQKAKAKLGLV